MTFIKYLGPQPKQTLQSESDTKNPESEDSAPIIHLVYWYKAQ